MKKNSAADIQHVRGSIYDLNAASAASWKELV